MKNSLRSRPASPVVTKILCHLLGSALLLIGTSRALASSPNPLPLPASSKMMYAPLVGGSPSGRPFSMASVKPMLAQTDPTAMVNKAVNFLSSVFLIFGCVVISYGGIQISKGHTLEGMMSIGGGIVLSIGIPLMRWFLQIAAGG